VRFLLTTLTLFAVMGGAGCGATTIQLSVAPTIDTAGHLGVSATVGAGIGSPVDFNGRSHHFVQALASAGGGYDGAAGARMETAGVDADYIYWARAALDLRAGVGFTYRHVEPVAAEPHGVARYAANAHVALLPVVSGDERGWLVRHLCIGAALRGELAWSDPSGERGLFSLPLLVELELLAAGD
jgi:hypothetical protein